MKIKYFLLFGIFIYSCKQKPEENKAINFKENPYMDAIYNSANADHPDDSSHIAKLNFIEPEFNFGSVEEGDSVKHIFYFVNQGNARLLISNCTSSCGCTVAKWPKGFILPGDTSAIKVVFNSRDKPGAQERNIKIISNAKPNESHIILKGQVIPISSIK